MRWVRSSAKNDSVDPACSKMPKNDRDVAWAIAYLEEDAEACSAVNGERDSATKDARRLETVVKRLAREAGYSTETFDVD